MTIKKIAQALQLSVGTVSMGLADSPKLKKETKREIQEYARLIGYRPNYSAKCLVRGKTFTIGVLLPSLSDPFYAEMIEKLSAHMEKEGFAGLFLSATTQKEYATARENIIRRGVDGVISKPLDMEDALSWKQENIATVFFDEDEQRADVDVVRSDEEKGGRLVAQHLAGLGHKKMGFIGPTDNYNKRYLGYLKGLSAFGITVRDEWIVDGLGHSDVGYEGLRKILRMEDRPTAMFLHNDTTAIGALKAADEAGMKVPEELAIVGFDDIKISQYTIPALTTVRADDGITRHLIEIILEKIRNKDIWTTRRIVLEPRLIVRQSSDPGIKAGS